MLNPGAPCPPLGDAEFAAALAALARFEPRPRIAVATSGGPDSLALAILADRWARRNCGEAWAVTVDHRLRPESGAETETLRGWLAARGIRHEVLAWCGAKPRTGLQEAAREARYRLLAQWCRDRGCLYLLTAHHREDQAETHLIRRRAGSGPDGLAAMSTVRELDGCLLLRPLLGVAKERLAAFLEAEGQPYLSDPSNLDPAFERARLRHGKGAPPRGETAALLAGIGAFGRQRMARERARDALLARAVALHPAGFALLDPAPLADAPEAIAEAAIGALARAVGGSRYPVRRERVARLQKALRAGLTGGRTLAGCRFVAWRGRVLAFREIAAAAPPVALLPGECRLWDRRFALALPDPAAAVRIGYLGRDGVAELNRLAPHLPETGVPRLLRPALPAAWDAAGLSSVPHLGYARPGAAVPRMLFRPLTPLIREGFTVVCQSEHPICRVL